MDTTQVPREPGGETRATVASRSRAPLPVAERLAGVGGSPVRDLLALAERSEVISFAGGLPAPELFDIAGLRDAFGRALAGAAAARNLQYAATEGDPSLRRQVAERLTSRWLPTSASDVLITSGSQQALTLIAAALLDPGAVVAVESPTYLAALQGFRLAGAHVVAVASDEEGMDPGAFHAAAHEHHPSLLYLVPTFANPTGRTMSAGRRQAVVDAAAAHGVWVIEDDPYGELRYDGDAVAPMAGLPGAEGGVLHLGSFSKVGAPGMRLGWVRAPEPVLRSLVIAKQAADLHSSTIDQAAAAIYLDAVDVDAHLARLRRVYRERRDAMLALLPRTLPDGARWTRPEGGMFVWVTLPPDHDAAAILPEALARGVAFVPGAPFFAADPDRATLRLSFTTHAPEVIGEGLGRLAEVVSAHA